jgi:hypothetical protein
MNGMEEFFTPQWFAVGREADIATEQIASGITALGRAQLSRKGLYTQAFFGLSIGIERLAKLIYISDHALENNGNFPDNDALRKLGHKLDVLLDKCQEISVKRMAGKEFSERPSTDIHAGIVLTLSEFAKQTRYYNLNFLSGSTPNPSEPIEFWWNRVGVPILHLHSRFKIPQSREVLLNKMSSHSTVIFHDENGSPIRDVLALHRHMKETEVVQKYGRLYCLQIVRWLVCLMRELSSVGGESHIEWLEYLYETFTIFMQEDRALKNRKTWLLYQ